MRLAPSEGTVHRAPVMVSAGVIIGDGAPMQGNTGAIVGKLYSASFLTPEMFRCLQQVRSHHQAPKRVITRTAVWTKREKGKGTNGATQARLGEGPSQSIRCGSYRTPYHSMPRVRRRVRSA